MSQPIQDTDLTRRGFLHGSGALTLCLTLMPTEAAAQERHQEFLPNVWLTIDRDGVVTIMSPAAEMGQGTMTALPIIIAEELDADWSKVRIAPAPLDAEKYGNPTTTTLSPSLRA